MAKTEIVYVTEHGSIRTDGMDKVRKLEARGYQIVAEREDARWVNTDGVHCVTTQYTLRYEIAQTKIVYVTEHGSMTCGYHKVEELVSQGYQIVAEREDARWVNTDGVHCVTTQYTLRKD